jgi:hypothetical protein
MLSWRHANSYRGTVSLDSCAGYTVVGSVNQPGINGYYVPNGQTLYGQAVYANRDSTITLSWSPEEGGYWTIQGTSEGHAILSNPQGIFAREAPGASPSGTASEGPHDSGWQTLFGRNTWVSEIVITVALVPAGVCLQIESLCAHLTPLRMHLVNARDHWIGSEV